MDKLFSLKGRISRLGYWRAQLFGMVVATLSWVLGLMASMSIGPLGGLVFVLIPVAVFIGYAAVLRRLHDRGKSVLWWWLFCTGPLALYGLAHLVMEQETPVAALEALPLALGGFGIAIWSLVELGFRRGQPGPNAYGEPAVAVARAPIGSPEWWA